MKYNSLKFNTRVQKKINVRATKPPVQSLLTTCHVLLTAQRWRLRIILDLSRTPIILGHHQSAIKHEMPQKSLQLDQWIY
jgi:hypothetical protein